MNKKQKRNRGIVLTIKGWQKFQDARIEHELRDNKGYKFTLEELGDRAELTTATLRKILTRDRGVDKRSVVTLFATLDLELNSEDYTSPKSQKRPDNDRPTQKKIDWGEAIDVSAFYGRSSELATLDEWLLEDGCRLITILGIGGIGKTALSVKLAEQVKDKYDYVIWRSLRDAPSIQDILTNLIQFLCGEQTAKAELPESTNEKISLLVECLRSSRCLIVLDNVESLFCDRSRAGICDEEYEEYDRLFQRVGESQHQSCLVLTTREKPKHVAVLEGEENTPVRALQLNGLKYKEGEKILQAKGLSASEAELEKLITYYDGNALALKIVATTIRDLFGGNVANFLRQNTAIFGDIRDLLDEQFNRSLAIEEKMMYWLAINREPTTLAQIQEDLAGSASQSELLESLESLLRRCLIDRTDKSAMVGKEQVYFTLQSVVMEYVTCRLIDNVCREIKNRKFKLFRFHALMKATAKDYIKNTQIRLILQPIIDKLLIIFKGKRNLENRLKKIIVALQEKSPREPGYTAGNIINMLCQMETDLTGYDFSNLCVWQADLCQTCLHDVNFQNADLAKSVFAENFGGIWSVAFSPDGEYLAAGDTKGDILLRRVADDQPIRTFRGHNGWVVSLDFSPDGKTLASSSCDCTAKLWDVDTGQCLHTLEEHEHEVWSVAFSPDGETLATGCDDNKARLWNVSTGECLKILQGHTDYVLSVAFSSSGQELFSGSHDNTIRLWDIKTGKCTRVFQGHNDGVRSVSVSPDSRMLASGSNDRTIRLWDIKTGECLKVFQSHSNGIWSVDFSSQGNFIASGSIDHTVRLWDIKTGECLKVFQGHSNWINSIAFNSQGSFIASGSYDQTVKLWNVNSCQCFKTFQGYNSQALSVTYSPNGQTLASGGHDRQIRLWDVKTGQVIKTLYGHANWVFSVAFSPQGNLLASGSGDKTIRLWDVSTGKVISIFRGHEAIVRSIAFSPDGQKLASGSEDKTIKLWDIKTGQTMKTLRGHQAEIWSIAFSPDGQKLASGSFDGTAKLWDVHTGGCFKTLDKHTSWVLSVAFSSDGRTLATTSGDQTIRLWNIDTGICKAILREDKGYSRLVAFSGDDTIIASYDLNHDIKLWKVSTGECFKSLRGHTALINSITFSPDSRTLASSSEDETIKLWNLRSGDCIKTLRVRKPYESMNIMGADSLTEANINTLKTLGVTDS